MVFKNSRKNFFGLSREHPEGTSPHLVDSIWMVIFIYGFREKMKKVLRPGFRNMKKPQEAFPAACGCSPIDLLLFNIFLCLKVTRLLYDLLFQLTLTFVCPILVRFFRKPLQQFI